MGQNGYGVVAVVAAVVAAAIAAPVVAAAVVVVLLSPFLCFLDDPTNSKTAPACVDARHGSGPRACSPLSFSPRSEEARRIRGHRGDHEHAHANDVGALVHADLTRPAAGLNGGALGCRGRATEPNEGGGAAEGHQRPCGSGEEEQRQDRASARHDVGC